MERWILTSIGLASLCAFTGLLFGVTLRSGPTDFKVGMFEVYVYAVFLPGVLLTFFIPTTGLTFLGATLSFAGLIEFRKPDRLCLRFSLGRLLLCVLLFAATMGVTFLVVFDSLSGIGRDK